MYALWSLFVFSFLSTSVVWAQEGSPLALSYKLETKAALEALKAAGIQKMACLDDRQQDCLSPDSLIKVIDSGEVRFKEVRGLKKPDGSTRYTAFYSPEEGAVLLNGEVPHESFGRGFVGLHELFGVKNRPEVEYEFSKGAFILIESKKAGLDLKPADFISLQHAIEGPVVGKEKNAIDDSNSQLITESGTVFGGGGDGQSLVQRLLFFQYLTRSRTFGSDMLHFHFVKMNIPIEVVDSDSNLITYIPAKKNYLGWPVKILVPRRLVSQKPVRDTLAPNRAIEDIVFYFKSIVPGMFPHLPNAQYKHYRNSQGEQALWPTFFSRFHPAALENRLRPAYNQVCAEGCQYLGVSK